MKNLRRSGILSDNFHDKVCDYSDNLIVVAEKVDQTHTRRVHQKLAHRCLAHSHGQN